MSQARWGLGVVAVADKIYDIGGLSVDGYVGTNERYDTTTDTWFTLEPMPAPRIDFGIVAYQKKIYCIGGYSYDKDGNFEGGKLTEVYDTLTNNWTAKAAYPYGNFGLDANVVDGKIFVVSGYDLFMYDPVDDSWTKKSDMPERYRSISGFGSVVLDDKIVVVDAYHFEADSKPKILFYDPKTDLWNKGQVGSLYATFRGNAVVTTGRYAPQNIYALNLAVNNVYDPIRNTWLTAETMELCKNNL
jgi:N-acetylneuraminic acid mutarotase